MFIKEVVRNENIVYAYYGNDRNAKKWKLSKRLISPVSIIIFFYYFPELLILGTYPV